MVDSTPNLVERAAARLQRSGLPFGTLAPAPTAGTGAPRSGPHHPSSDAPGSVTDAGGAQPDARQVPPVTVSPTTLAAHGISVPSAGSSRTVEEFRALKRQVLSVAAQNRSSGRPGNRIVLVTSARTGEGKTFTAVNLALALAFEKDTRVLLFDADAYRQSAISFLGISSDTGWLDAVTDGTVSTADLIVRTTLPGLSVLPAGKQRPEIPEIMASRRMTGLLDGLSQADPRRFIVMDALPCLSSSEPAILAALAEQTVFVVAAHNTSREDVESALRLLGGSPRVSLVLNKAEPLLCERFKGYGYAYANSR